MVITSTSNPKIKRLVSLRKKRKDRDVERVFLTEGIRMFREIPNGMLKELYVSETFYKKKRDLVEKKAGENHISPCILADHVLDYASDTKTPQGVLSVVKRPEWERMEDKLLEADENGRPPFLMALDNLQDPGNLGTIIRTAEGAGATGIFMSRDCVDLYNPKTIRSTMGSIYRMPCVQVEDIQVFLEILKSKNIRTYAAHLEGSRDYDKENYRSACAFLIGNEGNGLSDETARMADACIKIPMEGQVESLNAAIAATVLMFEAGRQRRNPQDNRI